MLFVGLVIGIDLDVGVTPSSGQLLIIPVNGLQKKNKVWEYFLEQRYGINHDVLLYRVGILLGILVLPDQKCMWI